MKDNSSRLFPSFAWVGLFTVGFVILFLRRPDALVSAQFYANDGKNWFADAYHMGALRSLFLPQDGHFQTLSRLVAVLVTPFGLTNAPLIFNIIALGIQALVPIFILSRRFEKILPSVESRYFLAFIFLCLNNQMEIHASLTGAHWYLSFIACTVLLEDPPSVGYWRWVDICILALSGISGPFSIFLLPASFIFWMIRRDSVRFYNFIIFLLESFVQLWAIFQFGHAGRLKILCQFDILKIATLFGKRVVWDSIVGSKAALFSQALGPYYSVFFSVAIVTAFFLMLYALANGSSSLRLVGLFSLNVFVASIISPNISPLSKNSLDTLYLDGFSCRYWVVPTLFFITTITWNLFQAKNKAVKILAALFSSGIIFGFIINFHFPAYVDYQFSGYAKKFERMAPGEEILIPINPQGWSMKLKKNFTAK